MKNFRLSFLFALAALTLISGVVGCSRKDNPNTRYIQTERMAIPALNTVLIVGDQNKDDYNTADPVNDVSVYTSVSIARLDGLRAAVGAVAGFPAEDMPGISSATLTSIVIPDVVTINFSNPVTFPNGRQLTDDVIDAELKLVLNRQHPAVSDAINANDRAFSATFPYLASAN